MNHLINMTNGQRGHETVEHRVLKRETITILRSCGYTLTLPEYICCDIVASRRPGKHQHVLAVEIERSRRNVLRNLNRNFAQGCDAVLIVCPDARSLKEVVATVVRHELNPSRIAFATPLTLRLLQPLPLSEPNLSEEQENPS